MCGDEAAAVRASLDCRYPVRSSYPSLASTSYYHHKALLLLTIYIHAIKLYASLRMV